MNIHNPDNIPKTGDLVEVSNTVEPVMLFNTWGSRIIRDTPVGYFYPSELGLVLETNHDQGGNGTQVMISLPNKVKIGWANTNFLRRINE